MNLTEKGGVALHFFASDRSRRNYIDALPVFLLVFVILLVSSFGGKARRALGRVGGIRTRG